MAVGHWLATAHCLCFWLFFFRVFFLFSVSFLFQKSRGFVQGPGIVEIGEDGVTFIAFFFSFDCTIAARLSVGTLGFLKLDTILYRRYLISRRDYGVWVGNCIVEIPRIW